jgi:hypothetical protein
MLKFWEGNENTEKTGLGRWQVIFLPCFFQAGTEEPRKGDFKCSKRGFAYICGLARKFRENSIIIKK